MLVVKSSTISEVASNARLNEYFQKQKKSRKPIFYILPSKNFLQEARKRKSGMAFKTFDDLADLILKKANIDYFPVSESERTLFFQQLMANERKRLLENPQELRHKAKAYANTYGQLKRIGLTIDDLPPDFKQMEALFRIYETEWVKEKRLLDPENKIHEAVSIEHLTALNLGEIVIDGYLDFSTLQYMVINYFVAKGVNITVYLPSLKEAEIVFETERELRKLGFSIETNDSEQRTNDPLVSVKSATTIEEEIIGVLEEISEKSSVTPLEQVGLILADERNYYEKLVKGAEERKIPLEIPQKKQVKDTLFIQFIHHSLLKHQGRFIHRWDRIDLVDSMLRLNFLASIDFVDQKKQFLETGYLREPLQNQLDEFITFRKKVPEKASIMDYLELLKALLESTNFSHAWKNKLLTETNTEKLKKIRVEWKAYEYFTSFITKKLEKLEEQRLHNLQVDYHIFVEWLFEGVQTGTIYEERAPQRGIQLHTFRDIALFSGKTLYVLGMNEGVFPKAHKLGGYFQESDLKHLPVRFASPTRALFRKKDDSFFHELFNVATEISFSYVVGVDPHNPLLPSVYLEQWKNNTEERKYSLAHRLAKKTSVSVQDFEEKIAYHVGIGKKVSALPASLEKTYLTLQKLELGTEKVSQLWESKLKRDKMSVTMLESYAMCPFKYALEKILNVKEPLEKQTKLDFRDVGSMLHQMIEKFYKQLELVGKPFSAYTEEMKETAEAALLEIFEEEWVVVEEQHRDFSLLQLSIEKEEWLKKMKKWWLAEKEHFWENKQLQSMHLFRLEEKVELEITLDDETCVTLSGKIDRIDIDEDGFVIYDYKSGLASLNFDKEVRPGLKLQLPLYLVAMEKRLANGHYHIDLSSSFANAPASITAHGASYISLRDPVKRAGNSVWREEHFGKNSRFRVHSKATKEETLEAELFLAKYQLKERLKELWQGSSQDFSVKPLKCMNSCSYKHVCRVTQDLIEEGEGEWK